MPGYDFYDVTITAFDVHTTIDPHLPSAPDFFQEEFAFFKSEEAYNQAYWSQRAAQTPHFIFRGLPQRVLRNHLWRRYIGKTDPIGSDAWALELPLVGHPPGRLLALSGDTNPQARTRLRVYLSPLGWSTNILIRLQGHILNRELIDFVARLTGKPPQTGDAPAESPLLMDGTPQSLTNLFRQVEAWLLEEVYVPDRWLGSHLQIPLHLVVSLNKFDGDIVGYKAMAPADQGLMLSILYGRTIEALEVVRGKVPDVLWTKISGSNFALTDFSHGTLVFAQREAQDPEREAALHCLVKNIRDCLMLTFTLMHFHTESQKRAPDADPEARVTSLRDYARSNLRRLRSNYHNEFCRNLFRHRKALKKLSSR